MPPLFQKTRPYRCRKSSTRRVPAEWLWFVCTKPNRGNESWRVAHKPDVGAVVCRARLARDRAPNAGRSHSASRAIVDDTAQQRSDKKCVSGLQYTRCVGGRMLPEDSAEHVLDAFDGEWRDPQPTVAERRIGRGQFDWRDRSCPQCERRYQRKIARDSLRVRQCRDALNADLTTDANRGRIRRTRERILQGDGARVLVVEVGRRPRVIAPHLDFDRLVVDHRCRRVATHQRRRVHKRLERRTRLTMRAQRAIESATFDPSATHQRDDGARRRIDRDECALGATVRAPPFGVHLGRAASDRAFGRQLRATIEAAAYAKLAVVQCRWNDADLAQRIERSAHHFHRPRIDHARLPLCGRNHDRCGACGSDRRRCRHHFTFQHG